jgi:GNAT superfamily N-acetyltransferase
MRPAGPVTAVPTAREVLDLEAAAALGWPGLHTETRDGWLLRAAAGFTGRGNSAIWLGEPPGCPADLDAALVTVRSFYACHGLPPMLQVPLPAGAPLRAGLLGRGWRTGHGAVVLTAPVTIAAGDPAGGDPALPDPEVSTVPGPVWLSLYRYRGADLPPVAARVLAAGPGPLFLTMWLDGAAVAVCRLAMAAGWAGITAVEVDGAHRRRGLAGHLLRHCARLAAGRRVREIYLQVESSNEAALRLYRRAGFTRHHDYAYVLGGPGVLGGAGVLGRAGVLGGQPAGVGSRGASPAAR